MADNAFSQSTPVEPSGRPIPDHPDALLTTPEAAFLVGLSVRSLESMRLRGDGPEYIALSRRAVRYERASLAAWISSCRRTSTSATKPPADVEVPNQGAAS